MLEISAGGGGGTRLSDRLNAGNTRSYWDILGDRFKAASAAGVYRDIDDALSAGGHDGDGSEQNGTRDDDTTDPNPKRKPYRPSPGRLRPPSARRTWDYYEAPLAEKYGFGKATAYQEALANTAYRREMDDMRKAGLNPSVIYGSHNTSGADSSIIPRDGSGHSGGSGGYSRRSRGGNSGKYLFSGGSYYGIMAAVGAMTAMATHNVGAGMAAAGLTGTALKAFNGFAKRK